MDTVKFPDAILVATDFSPSARRALDTALSWRQPTTEITLLHVIDTQLADRVESTGIRSRPEAIARLRALAEEQISLLEQEYPKDSFEPMVVEGVPFVEIVRVATDLVTSLIILGAHGSHTTIEGVLFGATAEKVVRSARLPVLCVP
jgi:glycine betaine transporter